MNLTDNQIREGFADHEVRIETLENSMPRGNSGLLERLEALEERVDRPKVINQFPLTDSEIWREMKLRVKNLETLLLTLQAKLQNLTNGGIKGKKQYKTYD